MPLLTQHFYDVFRLNRTKQYIETGAYKGAGINIVGLHYEHVHSIELSEKYYKYNVDQFRDIPSVHMYHGDSKTVLPGLLDSIKEPVTIHLDAHFSGGETAFGEEEQNGKSNAPLLRELELLQQRPYNDIIIIDDCRMIGRAGTEGDGLEWPFYDYDWTNITEQSVRDRMKPKHDLVKNTYCEYTNGGRDQWIIVPVSNYDHIMYAIGESDIPVAWAEP